MWKNALARSGISNFKWHDLRHTWASLMRQSGEGLDKIQELGGWQDPKMVRRYAHLSTDHLAKASSAIDRVFEMDDASLAHGLMESSVHVGKIMLKIHGDEFK